MRNMAWAGFLSALMGCTTIAHSQESGDGNLESRLDTLKTELVDATRGFYVSPLVWGSALTGAINQNGQDFDFDGYLVEGGAILGYEVAPFRMDVAFASGYAEIEADTLGDFDIISADVLASTYYDMPLDLGKMINSSMPSIKPYVGAGVGWVYLHVKSEEAKKANDANAALNLDEEGGDHGVVTQFLAGFGIRLSPQVVLDLGYRYFYIPRIEPLDGDDEVGSHSGGIRLRYRF